MAALLERCEPSWKTDLVGKPSVSLARARNKFGTRLDPGRYGRVYVSTGLGDRVAIKLVECKSDEEVNWAASEMHIVMTISGHRNVVSLIEAFYSDGMLVESTKVA